MAPTVSPTGDTVYTLAVPTEKENATTTKVVLTVPDGFNIDSFDPSPGWKRTAVTKGSGENTQVTSVTWTGGKVPTDEDAFFQFIGGAEKAAKLSFDVEQTYSNGEVVNWSGPESSDTPAPIVNVSSELGGSGGSSDTLAVIALIVAGIAALLGIVALVGRGRSLT
jgi:uncharacterized protein YcnI